MLLSQTLFLHSMERAGDDITDQEKSVHLLSCVKAPEAKQLVCQFTSQTDSFEPAIEALEKCYGNKSHVYTLYSYKVSP